MYRIFEKRKNSSRKRRVFLFFSSKSKKYEKIYFLLRNNMKEKFSIPRSAEKKIFQHLHSFSYVANIFLEDFSPQYSKKEFLEHCLKTRKNMYEFLLFVSRFQRIWKYAFANEAVDIHAFFSENTMRFLETDLLLWKLFFRDVMKNQSIPRVQKTVQKDFLRLPPPKTFLLLPHLLPDDEEETEKRLAEIAGLSLEEWRKKMDTILSKKYPNPNKDGFSTLDDFFL